MFLYLSIEEALTNSAKITKTVEPVGRGYSYK